MSARPPTRMTPVPRVRVAGVASPSAVIDVQSVTGPNPYAAGGVPVDLSATYSSILSVSCTRRYTTATKALAFGKGILPNETGTDLYSSAKFRIALQRTTSITPAGTNAAPVASATCIATCNQNHPNLSAVAFTGSSSGQIAWVEDTSTPNESAITYEFLVVGIPV